MKYIVIISVSMIMFFNDQSVAQATYEGNDNGGPPNSFIGWDNTVGDALQIRNDNDDPILFSTFGNENMEITSYRNVGVGTFGVGGIRPKFHAFLDPGNVSLGQGPFASMALRGENNYRWEIPNAVNIGVSGVSQGITAVEGLNDDNVGGSFEARNAWRNIGVDALAGAQVALSENVGELGWTIRAVARDHTLSNVGIVARATYGLSPGPTTEIVGISAGIDGAIGNPTEFAGAFQGDVQVWGDVYADDFILNSDAQFKTNIESLENALNIISEIQPKKYQFQTEQFSHLGFSEGEHFGVIAQELQEVLPELVHSSRMLTAYDTLGNVTAEPIDFLGVNYTGLIPILVAGMQEQQSIIDSQNEALANVMDQLNAMQTQIDNCCSGGTGFKNMGTGGEEEDQLQKSSPNGNVLDQNTPNPFRSQTTISYTLEQGGKVVLNVYDKNGKVVANLEEAEQPADNYRYEWDASGLPAGLYHYALYVDGELLVKKAIKLAD